jgi:hypothetical protein
MNNKVNPLAEGRPGSIRDFCEIEGFSRATYFKMRRNGTGPRERTIPGTDVTQITPQAHVEWKQRVENPTAEDLAQIERKKKERIARAHAAGMASVAKEYHISKRRQSGVAS